MRGPTPGELGSQEPGSQRDGALGLSLSLTPPSTGPSGTRMLQVPFTGEIKFNAHFPRFKMILFSSSRPRVSQNWEMAQWLQISLEKAVREANDILAKCGFSGEGAGAS